MRCFPPRQPGSLAEIAGVEVEDYYALLSPVSVSDHRSMGYPPLG